MSNLKNQSGHQEATPETSQENIKEESPQTPGASQENGKEESPQTPEESSEQTTLKAENDKYLRLYAEFENFRRRTAQEKMALVTTASEGLLKKLLPIVDDFERALEALPQDDVTAATAAQEGIQLIHNKLMHLLQQSGVQPMAIEKGATFDAELHEAIAQTPVNDTALQGKVIEVIEKGYWLEDKVLRFAKVVIGA